MEDPISLVDRLFRRAGIRYVLIGAHAINVWLEPRFTQDVDITVEASTDDLRRLGELLSDEGLTLTHSYGQDQPSGPDFLRFVSQDRHLVLELQTAKTTFQIEAIARAVTTDGARVATREDLIVMKLIADRPKDRVDLASLAVLEGLDWAYIERWAELWKVGDRLQRLRADTATG